MIGKLVVLAEAMFIHPIFWGVVAFLALAFTLSGKVSVNAAIVCLWIAWAAAVFGIYRAEIVLKLDPVLRYLALVGFASIFAIGAVLLGRWIVQPKQGASISIPASVTGFQARVARVGPLEGQKRLLGAFKPQGMMF